MASFVIHADDTPIDVRGARTKEKYTARFWTYWGDDQHPLVWFDFTRSRKRTGPDAVPANFRGYLQADGDGGYDDYEGVELSDLTPILKVACWVHSRRKFREAHKTEPKGAGIGLAFIRRLYAIEGEIEKQLADRGANWPVETSAQEVAALRQKRAQPVLAEFRRLASARRLIRKPDGHGHMVRDPFTACLADASRATVWLASTTKRGVPLSQEVALDEPTFDAASRHVLARRGSMSQPRPVHCAGIPHAPRT